MSENQQQIADAKIERDRLSEECFQLLYRISRKPSHLKLLRLAKAHLEMLSNYKNTRQSTQWHEIS